MSDSQSFSHIQGSSGQSPGHWSQDGSFNVSGAAGDSIIDPTTGVYTSDRSRPTEDERADTGEALGAPDPRHARQENEMQRQARWKAEDLLFSKYPLYTVVRGDNKSGTSAHITVRGDSLHNWLLRVESILNYRRYSDTDQLGIQLTSWMVSLGKLLPVAPAEAPPWIPGASTSDPYFSRLLSFFGDIALTFWIFALNPIEEYYGVKEELYRMRENVEDMLASEGARATPQARAVILTPLSPGRREMTDPLALRAGQQGIISKAAIPTIRRIAPFPQNLNTGDPESTVRYPDASGDHSSQSSMFSLSDSRQEPLEDAAVQKVTPATELGDSTLSLKEATLLTAWEQAEKLRLRSLRCSDHLRKLKKQEEQEKLECDPPLYEILPKWACPSEGKKGVRIKGETVQYWQNRLQQRYDVHDPTLLASRLSALLDVLRDPTPCFRDRLEWQEAPWPDTLQSRRRSFAKEVALAVWYAAEGAPSDCDKSPELVGWLEERAFSFAGLQLPTELSGSNYNGTVSKASHTTTGAASTTGGAVTENS